MNPSATAAAERPEGRFNLTHAVLGSLLLHLLFVLVLSLLRSFGAGEESPLAAAETDELTFTFASTSTDSDERGRQEGLIPTEENFDGDSSVPLSPSSLTPPGPSTEQLPSPAVTPAEESLPPQFGQPDQQLAPPPEPIEEPPAERPEEFQELDDPEPIEEQIESQPIDPFEAEGQKPTLPQSQPPPRFVPPPQGNRREPTLSERLQNYGEAIERYREANPPRASGPPTNVFQPDWSQIPSTGQAIGSLRFESTDYDWGDYGRQIYWILWRSWHNRLLERADEFERWAQQTQVFLLDHFNGVQFTIESNGEISGILIELESGCVPLDFSSTEALAEAVLPPLPDDFPRDREVVHVTFIADGPIAPMRRGLQYLKQRGLF